MSSAMDKGFEDKYWALLGGLLLILFNCLRAWPVLSVPGLHVEDAALFGHYYGHYRSFTEIFTRYGSQPYLTTVPDFFAWLISFVDVRVQPLLYVVLGSSCAALTASMFFFTGVIRSRVILVIGPLVLGLAGLNHIYYHVTLIYVMYTGTLLLFILLFLPPPQAIPATTTQLLLFLALPWCGPYSVLFLPLSFLYLLFYRNRKKMMLVLAGMASTVIYLLTVTESTIQLANISKIWVIKRYFQVLLEKIILMQIFQKAPLSVLALVGALVLLLFYFFRKDVDFLKVSTLILALAGMALALFFLSIKFPLYLFTSDCHRVISLFCWLLFLLLVGDRVIAAAGSGWKIPVSTIICAFLCWVVIFDNIKFPERRHVKTVTPAAGYTGAIFYFESLQLERNKQAVCVFFKEHACCIDATRVNAGYRGEDAERLWPEDFPADVPYTQYLCPY